MIEDSKLLETRELRARKKYTQSRPHPLGLTIPTIIIGSWETAQKYNGPFDNRGVRD